MIGEKCSKNASTYSLMTLQLTPGLFIHNRIFQSFIGIKKVDFRQLVAQVITSFENQDLWE